MTREKPGIGCGVVLLGCVLLLLPGTAFAGGPLLVGGPGFGIPGQAFTWDPATMPVKYRVDSGPLSASAGGTVIIDNATGVSRVQAMFNVWQNVATANISYQNIGPILATGSFTGGDVRTVSDFSAVDGSCSAGIQSPIVFDADGSLVLALIGDPNVIGFASPCALDSSTGHILTGEGLLNGAFLDPSKPFHLTSAQFDEVFVHEFGHFSGLDHSQINDSVFLGQANACTTDQVAGLPVMFPVLYCQARTSLSLPPLAPDDMAWISKLYPAPSPAPPGKQAFSSVYGTIHGAIFFTDGVTMLQGANMLVRQNDNPSTPEDESLRVAFSVVSGYQFTGNFGQSVTCSSFSCNTGGSPTGSRDPALIGAFDIPVLAGTYSVSAESVDPGFFGSSGLNPLNFSIPLPGGTPAPVLNVVVSAGATVNVTLTLPGTPPRFDSFEARLFLPPEIDVWLRGDRQPLPAS